MVAPAFDLPNAAELRKTIIDLSDKWHDEFNPQTQGGEYVSLMIDGARMAHCSWLGICIATVAGFSFWRMPDLPGTTGLEIASAVAKVVEDLRQRGFTTVGVVTDNASNEIKAVRDLADITKLPIFRIPCLSHTTNLAVKDFLEAAFVGPHFWTDISKLCGALPHATQNDPFSGIRMPCPTRWLSLGEFVSWLRQHIKTVTTYLEKQGTQKAAYKVLRRYRWDQLAQCFAIMDRYTRWTEDQKSTMPNAWPTAVGILGDLESARRAGNPYAASFHRAFYNRMMTTADVPQLLLGYLITAEGIEWYRSLPDTGSPVVMATKGSVESTIDCLLRHFARLFHVDDDVFVAAWGHVMRQENFNPTRPVMEFWNRIRPKVISVGPIDCPLRRITEMVQIVSKLPVSEAEVERTFSCMRQLFGDRGQRAKGDLVEARLTIRMNKISISPHLLKQMDGLEDGDGDDPSSANVSWGFENI
jgi:hypothetical protein